MREQHQKYHHQPRPNIFERSNPGNPSEPGAFKGLNWETASLTSSRDKVLTREVLVAVETMGLVRLRISLKVLFRAGGIIKGIE